MRQTVATILKSIERYNPANLQTLERYVEMQSRENTYDLEANLAVLKLYQFNPEKFNPDITCQILLKALTNFPHTDFTLCKCLLLESVVSGLVHFFWVPYPKGEKGTLFLLFSIFKFIELYSHNFNSNF